MKNALVYLFITLPAIGGTPFQYNIFQGNPYSGAESRHRNKNWCAYVTQKHVSCVVPGESESVQHPELVPCPPEQPNCVQQVIYRTHFRPTYKIGYKVVSELEWRCCPGYQGYDCREVKDMTLLPAQRSPALPLDHNIPTAQGSQGDVENSWAAGGNFPIVTGRDPSSGRSGSQNAQNLEEEVQRLSQMVLDMQARMTDMASSLRVDFQEDASKMLVSLLNDLKQPASVRGADTQTLSLQDLSSGKDLGEVMTRINQVTGDLEFNTNTLDGLLERVNRHDGQLHQLMNATEKSSSATPPSPLSSSGQAPDLRPYVDEKIRLLREELMEGIDIKMADLKNSCDYKMMSVQELCDSQESHYLSLTELMDSKESDLRNEIDELKSKLAGGGPSGSASPPDSVVARVENIERCLNISEKASVPCFSLTKHLSKEQSDAFQDLRRTVEVKLASMQDKLGSIGINATPRNKNANLNDNTIHDLQHRLNLTEAKVSEWEKLHHDYKKGINSTENLKEQEGQNNVRQEIAHLDSRMAVVEGLCGKLEPISNSLQRIKDGLNKHITSLWTCVNQMNGTMRTQSRDLGQLRETYESLQNALSEVSKDLPSLTTSIPKNTVDQVAGPPPAGRPKMTVMETGEAGPPGRMTSSQLPEGAGGSMTPLQGFAGAPASSPKSSQTAKPAVPVEKMAFSAGLTLTPFLGDVGIIRFNKVLLNDGGHYDPYTGIFTTPADGRYLVTAVLAPQRGERVEAVLSVSNHSIQKVDSRGFSSGAVEPHEHCNCSSVAPLSLVLPLRQGDRVGLVLTAGKLAISASSEILSSFSAVLLIPGLDKR